MNLLEREKKYEQLILYLATPIGRRISGEVIFPTNLQASAKFHYAPEHISRLRTKFKVQINSLKDSITQK